MSPRGSAVAKMSALPHVRLMDDRLRNFDHTAISNPNTLNDSKSVSSFLHMEKSILFNTRRLNLVAFLLPISCGCNPQTPLSID
jgi:hypothetical protein